MITAKTHKELKPVLMNPDAAGVKDPYYVIHGEGYNITVVTPGKNGVEYNKTHGHFHKYQGAERYQCLYGQGLVVMQRNDESGEAKEFRITTLTPGKQVEVPAGSGHALVNVGRTFLVVLDNAPEGMADHDYETVKEKKGFAYYVVEKKGEIGFEQNPMYEVHPQINAE